VDYQLKKQNRLLNAGEFGQVFDNTRFKASARHAMLLAIPTDLAEARMGLVMSKKNVGNAVTRNRIKRLCRELFRHRKAELNALDIVVLARSGLGELENDSVIAMLNQLFDQLIARCKHADKPRDGHASHHIEQA
jgi:ribonuclease P protein component